MTFIIVFFAVITASIILPYFLRLLFRTERMVISKVPVFIGSTPFSYAFVAGCFGTEHIFVNARFSNKLNDAQKKALIMHELAHVKYMHVTIITIFTALKYAIIIQLAAFFMSLVYIVCFVVIFLLVDSFFTKLMKPIRYAHEFKADGYAAFRSGFKATIIDLYYSYALNKSTNTHPSVAERLNKISEINLSNEKN